jgi:prepilin-type N-terminal cleavage/methylation domain-containing protein/prepilin-type processing-associated H-X9-DG protein
MKPLCASARRSIQGFTLIELLVVIAIIGILMSLLIGGISSVRRRAELAQCTSNLRQIYTALVVYADNHNGRFPRARVYAWDPWPPSWSWENQGDLPWLQDTLIPYLGGDIGQISAMFRCPGVREAWLRDDPAANHYRYNTMNASGASIAACRQPQEAILMFDTAYADWTRDQLPHNETVNAIHADGHVAALNLEEFLAPGNGGDNSYTTPMMTRGWK